MNNRIDEIKGMIQYDSEDPFLWYARALEYQKKASFMKPA
jgi:hypothetical protein